MPVVEEMRIYVPTRGRVNRQITRRDMALELCKFPVTYVIPVTEELQWKSAWGPKNYRTVPDHFKFSDIRQWILEQCGGKYHVVIDDDLRIAQRLPNQIAKMVNIGQFPPPERAATLHKMFLQVKHLMRKGWLHGGISVRQGNNRIEAEYKMAHREMRFHFYNAEAVRALGYDFRRVVTKQDLDFTLWMLRHGIPNIVWFEFSQEQNGNNVHGGCSVYRTEQVMEDGAVALASLHPDYVKIVVKTPISSWGGNPRVDVNIQWLKAYEEGKRYYASLQKQDPATLDDQDRAVLRVQPKLPLLPH